MITKRVRIEDGDFSNINDLFDWLSAITASLAGLTDDITIYFEGGQSWGSSSAAYSLLSYSGSVHFNGHTITIASDPADSVPSVFYGIISLEATSTDAAAAVFLYRKIKCGSDAGLIISLSSGDFQYWNMENCVLCMKVTNNFNMSGGSDPDLFQYFKNCAIFLSCSTQLETLNFYCPIHNTVVCVFSSHEVNFVFTGTGSPFTCYAPSFYNYGAGGLKTSLTAAVLDDPKAVDPVFAEQVIQSAGDVSETMMERSCALTAASSDAALDSGNIGQSAITDILGIARPQGNGPDRGPYEFVPAPAVYEATILDLDADELEMALRISLGCDRRQPFAGEEPKTKGDRRGWWGDVLNPDTNDRIGSRIWLLRRAKMVDKDVLKDAREYAKEALQWLVDDKIVKEILITVEKTSDYSISTYIDLVKPLDSETYRYSFLWNIGNGN